MASSCETEEVAMGMPCRIIPSLPVQQMPTMLMPSIAPAALAASSISGAKATTISESTGLWPCTARLTAFFFSVPRLAAAAVGAGEGALAAAEEQVPRVGVHAVRRPVHDLRDRRVDPVGQQAHLAELLEPRGGQGLRRPGPRLPPRPDSVRPP